MKEFLQGFCALLLILLLALFLTLITKQSIKAEQENKLIEIPNFTRMYGIEGEPGYSVYRYNYNKRYYLINWRGGMIEIESPELNKK